jgi:Protein of unknown function (DUF3604)
MVEMVGRTRVALLAIVLCCAPLAGCDSERRPGPAADAGSSSADQDGAAAGGRCKHFDAERQPFFGDLHVHTALSLDANLQGTRLRPRDAYRFARGEQVDLPPYDASGNASRRLQLERPLDFVAVSDHAEFLGLVNTCLDESSEGFDSLECLAYRTTQDIAFITLNARLAVGQSNAPAYAAPCLEENDFCEEATLSSWGEIQEAAAEANDESEDCSFSSFVGYEWSGSPGTQNLHRNVIFRSSSVPRLPFSYFDGSYPEQLWAALREECRPGQGCDVLTIPHNSNLSAGLMFEQVDQSGQPFDTDYASTRAQMEPLVEIFQHKGSSECMPEQGPDELCSFELMPYNTLASTMLGGPPDTLVGRDFVRDALGQGLVLQQQLGTNPFAYGFVASTDTHLGIPGAVDEGAFQGHGGAGSNARVAVVGLVDKAWLNPGGLAVLWAEENSRDALFSAMRRREAYGTSGPRIVLRVFAGYELPDDLCEQRDFVKTGYAEGVPMGGVLGKAPAQAAPRVFVRAERDPGTRDTPGGLLERIQIVKGFVVDGAPRYRVFDIAGGPGDASVDEKCRPQGEGHDALCGTFRDPDFDADQPAFYYARVLENPSCRWQARLCRAAGVDCESGSVPSGYQGCCEGYPELHQERAWSSPIFYRPERSAD